MELQVDAETAENIQERLARIEGQVRGISKMVAGRRPCDQVLMQIMAARAAPEKVAATVVNSSIGDCLALPPQEARKVISRSINMLTQV